MATVLGLSHHTSLGNGLEELEGRDHAVEDGLGALDGQRQDEGGVGVGPGGDEEGDQAPALGEVDVDVTEIGFEPLTGEMSQRHEGFLMSAPMSPDVALHLGVTAVDSRARRGGDGTPAWRCAAAWAGRARRRPGSGR